MRYPTHSLRVVFDAKNKATTVSPLLARSSSANLYMRCWILLGRVRRVCQVLSLPAFAKGTGTVYRHRCSVRPWKAARTVCIETVRISLNFSLRQYGSCILTTRLRHSQRSLPRSSLSWKHQRRGQIRMMYYWRARDQGVLLPGRRPLPRRNHRQLIQGYIRTQRVQSEPCSNRPPVGLRGSRVSGSLRSQLTDACEFIDRLAPSEDVRIFQLFRVGHRGSNQHKALRLSAPLFDSSSIRNVVNVIRDQSTGQGTYC